jgi:RuvB-like protein 2
MWQARWPDCALLCHAAKCCCCDVQAAEVEIEDVSRAYTLFIDVKRSTEFLVAHESDYMFNQVRHTATCIGTNR